MSSPAAPPPSIQGPDRAGWILALDTASPQVSVAVASPEGALAERSVAQERSSRTLLAMIDEALTEAGVALPGLAGIVAVRGPGSFTGLRVGLATAYGLHQATGLPVTAVSTWQALAAAAPAPPGRPVAAAVDILRGLWAVQTFTAGDPPRAQGDPRRLAAADLSTLGPALLAGFGTTTLALPPDAGLEPWEPPALAAAVARSAARSLPCWNPALLTAPLYFQPPAVTPPGVRPPGARRS